MTKLIIEGSQNFRCRKSGRNRKNLRKLRRKKKEKEKKRKKKRKRRKKKSIHKRIMDQAAEVVFGETFSDVLGDLSARDSQICYAPSPTK